MNAEAPLFQIEARRIAAGISRADLAAAAGVSLRTFSRLVATGATPRPATIGKLRTALARLGRVQGQTDTMTRLVAATFHAALALVCLREGVSPAEILRHEPGRRATADPAWRRAAHLRQRAIALVNQGLDLQQSELVRALGITPAAVSLAMGAVEDARHEDPQLDQAMDEMERMLRGEA